DSRPGYLGHGREDRLLVTKVLVKRPDREFRGADDVAHAGRLVTEGAEDLSGRREDDRAIARLGLLALAEPLQNAPPHGKSTLASTSAECQSRFVDAADLSQQNGFTPWRNCSSGMH